MSRQLNAALTGAQQVASVTGSLTQCPDATAQQAAQTKESAASLSHLAENLTVLMRDGDTITTAAG